ncbi:LysR substrate-binding domain-containing protein [Streptomyces bottropensis]|uniref:LysR substrate-binding domain-containing protein n=1 Tax=Streptomyces bottropensis TaxID=42235 RepID=UPI0037F4AD61
MGPVTGPRDERTVAATPSARRRVNATPTRTTTIPLTAYASAIGRQLAEPQTAPADLRAGRTGRLSVRYFATAVAALVAPAVARPRAEHPGVRVELGLVDPDDPLPAVKEGRAGLALVVRPGGADPEGVTLLRLPAAHPLADRPALARSEWPGPCLDAQLEACAQAAGFRPRFVVESEDYTTAQGFVAAGLGVGLIPASASLPPPGPRRTPPHRAGTPALHPRGRPRDGSGAAGPEHVREGVAGRRRRLGPAIGGTRCRRYALTGASSLSPAFPATWRGSAYGSAPYQRPATV